MLDHYCYSNGPAINISSSCKDEAWDEPFFICHILCILVHFNKTVPKVNISVLFCMLTYFLVKRILYPPVGINSALYTLKLKKVEDIIITKHDNEIHLCASVDLI